MRVLFRNSRLTQPSARADGAHLALPHARAFGSSAVSRLALQRECSRGTLLGEAVLLDLLRDAVARHGREVVDEEHAIQVIHLVLDDAREETLGLEVYGLAVLVRGLDGDPLAALDVPEDAGQRETSLLVDHGSASTGDDGIDEGARAALAVVHDEQTIGDAHLRRGQPDADLVVHRLDHVADQPAELGRDLAHVRGFAPQRAVAVEPDVEQCHWVRSPNSALVSPGSSPAARRARFNSKD